MQLDDCICSGQDVTFQCTVCGEGGTEWSGSLFRQCTSGAIYLRHREFSLNSTTRACGKTRNILIAKSIGPGEFDANKNLTCYTSQLNLHNITTTDNNNTVTCVHVESGSKQTVVDTTTLLLTTGITCT